MAIKTGARIGVVIPCYKASNSILDVIEKIPDSVMRIIVVDDGCPEKSGQVVLAGMNDPRVEVLFHEVNRGVGAAMCTGYCKALEYELDVMVKLDADGQIDPGLIMPLCEIVIEGEADYAKGNRFFDVESLKGMPFTRLIGNGVLSFVNKVVSGYWPIMDPTNGFTCIHSAVLRHIPLQKVAPDYFFESDMLFRLSTLKAVVADFPMSAQYQDEASSLRITRVLMSFPGRYMVRFLKRIFYNYFIRDFNAGTVFLLGGLIFLLSGLAYGLTTWISHAAADIVTPVGQVMLAALPVLIGVQMLLAAVNYDVESVPRHPVHKRLRYFRSSMRSRM